MAPQNSVMENKWKMFSVFEIDTYKKKKKREARGKIEGSWAVMQAWQMLQHRPHWGLERRDGPSDLPHPGARGRGLYAPCTSVTDASGKRMCPCVEKGLLAMAIPIGVTTWGFGDCSTVSSWGNLHSEGALSWISQGSPRDSAQLSRSLASFQAGDY